MLSLLNYFYVIFSVHTYMLTKRDAVKAKHYPANSMMRGLWDGLFFFFLPSVKDNPLDLDTAGIHNVISPERRFLKSLMWNEAGHIVLV